MGLLGGYEINIIKRNPKTRKKTRLDAVESQIRQFYWGAAAKGVKRAIRQDTIEMCTREIQETLKGGLQVDGAEIANSERNWEPGPERAVGAAGTVHRTPARAWQYFLRLLGTEISNACKSRQR